jgi:uncharacterized membrane protein
VSGSSHPYSSLREIRHRIDQLETKAHLLHPQELGDELRRERSALQRLNGNLADRIVGLAGTMIFFYALCLVLGSWTLWQSLFAGNNGFDPFPYAFLFFVLGGIMQSLFVPTMLTASNRSAERDRIKDEIDHRAWKHLYEVNDMQLTILKELAARIGQAEERTT